MDLSERQQVFGRLRLKRGKNVQGNIQEILDALWHIAPDGTQIERAVFRTSIARLRPRLWQLERAGCIRLTYSGEPGNAVIGITPLQRKAHFVHSGEQKRSASEPEPKMQEIILPQRNSADEKLPPHCLVFIDMPNILYFEQDAQGERVRFLDLYRTNWDKFRDVISKITEIPLLHQTCYAYLKTHKKGGERLEEMAHRLNRHHEIHTMVRKRKDKDVDCMIDPMVVSESLKYMLCRERELKVVMVSGDSDRSFALIEVRKWAKMLDIKLNIYVLAWKESLSGSDSRGELLHIADETHQIETYLREFDPRGYHLWKEMGRIKRAENLVWAGISAIP